MTGYQRIVVALVAMGLMHWAAMAHILDGQQYMVILVTILGAFGATKVAEHWPTTANSSQLAANNPEPVTGAEQK